MLFNADRHDRNAIQRRPVWMPHPGLLALIGVLWVLAGVAQAVPSL